MIISLFFGDRARVLSRRIVLQVHVGLKTGTIFLDVVTETPTSHWIDKPNGGAEYVPPA
jgi:hypothetical protein